MTTAGSLPEVRRQASFRLWLLNLAFATVVGANYLWHVPEVEGARTWFFALPALVSTTLFLTILPGFGFWFVAHYIKGPQKLGLLQASFWTLFQVLLFADTRVFNMFGYHMNSQVWNLIFVRGSEDSLHLGWQVWTSVTVGLASVVVLQLWFWRRSIVRVEEKLRAGARLALARPWILAAALLLPAVLVEKSLYAQASLSRDRQITHLARLFPLYARVPAEDFATRVLGMDSEHPEIPKVQLEGYELDYPHALPAVSADGPRPSVLLIVVDCLRRDRLTPEYMPRLATFAEDARRFENHVSGGNSTRFGLFSLIYGLHGSYWFPTLEERRSPVLVDTLLELGYSFGIFGSASMDYPEMRSTLWSAVDADVRDDFGEGPAWVRDELAAEDLSGWIDSLDADQPFFGFLLLDSPHQTYSYPPDRAPFQPAAAELDYMSMTRNAGPDPAQLELVVNRYNNAVLHADTVAGRVLERLRESSRFDNTLVVITGDHGEEFLEPHHFGHTSAFTPEQIEVPFLLRGPGVAVGTESGPTSHLDFAPTLLEMLGANPTGRTSWTLGRNLFEPEPGRNRVLSAWNELGVWTEDAVLRVPLSLFEFDIEAYDYDWNRIYDDTELLAREAETLLKLSSECNRFLERLDVR